MCVISLGKVIDIRKFEESTSTGNREVIRLVTNRFYFLEFQANLTELKSLEWMRGKEVTRENTGDGDHLMVEGLLIATVRHTAVKLLFYPSAAENARKKIEDE